ncbi:MAG TPA: TerB family tellurite resistance protein [Azospirillaceae bacterium]|nr:TerB family tellurite resistance protein [Azospirillaceae bacterium]
MSIWGKILGGAAGFAVGGPLGALIGAVAGHAVDEYRASEAEAAPEGGKDNTRSIAFTIGVIALGAKMAKADGVVHRVEVDAFKRVFHVPPDELKNVGRVFDLAKRDTAGFELYAKQLAGLFKDRRTVLEDLLGGLFSIARADGKMHDGELRYLAEVARIFGFTDAEYQQIRRIHGGPEAGIADPLDDPYAVLGISAAATDDEIKAAWRRLTRENHPDRVMAQGLPEEFVEIATDKMAAINAAYDRIMKERAPAGVR